jgi:hypothetical protein
MAGQQVATPATTGTELDDNALARALRAADDEWCAYLDDLEDALESGSVVVDGIRLEGDAALRALGRKHERAFRQSKWLVIGGPSRALSYVPPARGRAHTGSARPRRRGAGRPAGRPAGRRRTTSTRAGPSSDSDPSEPPRHLTAAWREAVAA